MLALDFAGLILAGQLRSGLFAATDAVLLVYSMVRQQGRIQDWALSLVLFGYGPFLIKPPTEWR
ncbi:hypothetical protein ACFQ6S_40285 [Streptomyces sp. NPDC056479]|uniref:hypothetical protein n=1 Tax=Streptomyces sp. NPDC056479 TaxID=3345832 RepID=UPI0036D0FD53